MPSFSQFTIYSSSDRYGPGQLGGQAGSLLTVLNACLVNGYGTGSFFKPAAGWLKPVADSGSVYGCFQQPSGSGFTVFVNDSGSSGTTQEAEFTGWQYITSASLPGSSNTTNVGAGYGQFPLPVQSLGTGKINLRKSATTGTGTLRNWLIAADAYTFYIWIATGDTNGVYYSAGFGDFYSLYGAGRDPYRCFIFGRGGTNNTATALGFDFGDALSMGPSTTIPLGNSGSINVPLLGIFGAANPSGFGLPIQFSKKGDATISNNQVNNNTYRYCVMQGAISTPNGPDTNYYLSPLWVVNPSNIEFRGMYRGLYQVLHSPGNFSDGQTISGTGNFAGKTFLIIKGGINGGFWALETSATISTN
jgi:hypothetical protein